MVAPETPDGVATLATPVAPAARHSHSDRPPGAPRGVPTPPPRHWAATARPGAASRAAAVLLTPIPPCIPPCTHRATYRAAAAARCSRCAHACGRVPRHCRFQQPRAVRRDWGGELAICAPPPVNARLGMSLGASCLSNCAGHAHAVRLAADPATDRVESSCPKGDLAIGTGDPGCSGAKKCRTG